MRKFTNTAEGIADFKQNARSFIREYIKHVRGESILYIEDCRNKFFNTIEIAEEDYEDAEYYFDEVFKEEWETAHAEICVVLAKTPHGKPVWYTVQYGDLDRSLDTIKVLGPYLIGPEGYENAEEATLCDPEFSGSLDDPETWEEKEEDE